MNREARGSPDQGEGMGLSAMHDIGSVVIGVAAFGRQEVRRPWRAARAEVMRRQTRQKMRGQQITNELRLRRLRGSGETGA